jgi:hypothetical protein
MSAGDKDLEGCTFTPVLVTKKAGSVMLKRKSSKGK